MRKRLLAIPLLAATALWAQDTQTQTPRQRPDPTARIEQSLTRFLQLDSAQQNQLHTILEEAKVVNQNEPMTQRRDLRKSLIEAVKVNDTAQIDAVTAQITTLEQQRAATRAKTAAKIYAILTDSQRAVVGDNFNMLMGGMGPMGPKRGPMGFGGRGRGNRQPPPPPQTETQ